MSEVFEQDINTKEHSQEPFPHNMLFKQPVELPDTQKVTEVCRKHRAT